MILKKGAVLISLGFFMVDALIVTEHFMKALQLLNILFWLIFSVIILAILKNEVKN